jgi:hypothetical protein
MAPVRANTIGTSGTNKSRYDQSINARTVDIFNYCAYQRSLLLRYPLSPFSARDLEKPSCPPRAPHTLCLAASLIFFRVAYWRTIVAATVTALLAVCAGSLVRYSVAATPARRGPGRGRVGGLPYRLANLVSGGPAAGLGDWH